jgi:hypothetical protein
MFLQYLLVRVFKFIDPGELALDRASDFQILPSSTYLIWCSKQMKTTTSFLRFGDGDAQACNFFGQGFSPLD